MQRPPKQPGKEYISDAGMAALGLVLGALLATQAWVPQIAEPVRHTLFDLLQRVAPTAPATSESVAVIAIDEESIARVGQWPWPRDVVGRLVEAAGRATVGLGVLLAERDRTSIDAILNQTAELTPAMRAMLASLPSNDDRLADIIARRRVVLASATSSTPVVGAEPAGRQSVLRVSDEPTAWALSSYPRILEPLPVLAGAASGIGVVGVTLSRDGTARRVAGLVRSGGVLAPGFGVELLRVNESESEIRLTRATDAPQEMRIGNRHIPIDASGHVWLRYDTTGRPTLVPAWQVLAGTHDVKLLQRPVVLIGTTAVGLGDSIPTPLGIPLSAIEIQAHAVANMLGGRTPARPANILVTELALTFTAGGAVIFASTRRRVAWLFAVMPIVIGLLLAAAWVAFTGQDLLLDTAFAMVAAFLLFTLALGWRLLAEAQKLRARERDLQAALLKAAAADHARSEFLANTSHELRTPLTAIMGFSEMMQLQVLGPLHPTRYVEYATHITDSARHLLAIMDDLLDMSLIDLGELRINESELEIAPVMQNCLTMIGHRATAKRITIETRLAPDLPRLRADAKMLRQMLLNLLGNAIKFSPESTKVVLRADCVDDAIIIAVKDEGPGMSRDEIPLALERFQKLGVSTVANPTGIGLGLPLTRAMIEIHAGQLEIDSQKNLGTEIRLRFPAFRTIR